MEPALWADALSSRTKGPNAYVYRNAGPSYKDSNLEQEAMILEDWWAGNTRLYRNQTGIRQDPTSYGSNTKTGQF